MPTLLLPDELRELLKADASLEGTVLSFVGAVEKLLSDNKLPFFPDFTDHGADHVAGVLNSTVRLIRPEVWASDLLRPKDAAVMIGATLLHDLGMHVRESGFVELVSPGSRWQPLAWFDAEQTGRAADRPWAVLWKDFQREARHFGVGKLVQLLGPANSGVPAIAFEDDLDSSAWRLEDRLLVGEFLRRHHARLAHEIAVFGFPGADIDDFPRFADQASGVGDLAGVVARSHGENLRLMVDYLGHVDPGNLRPRGVVAGFHMGLLRVADYLQLESDRAPRVLLQLRDPQSVVSVREWSSHGAVEDVSWDHSDPSAIHISVAPQHSLRTHLSLRRLLAGLQSEMDATAAVLDQTYSAAPLDLLRLSRHRVTSNLDVGSMHSLLGYVPVESRLQSDPDLFRLVVQDLYGAQPAVAGREFVQNAIDAVRRARAAGFDAAAVEVELVEEGNGDLRLVVADTGVGMPAGVIVDYYLKAGASLGSTQSESLSKAGRFGIGAFAGFLFSDSIHVVTRPRDAPFGLEFAVHLDDDLTELAKIDSAIGTRVTVSASSARLATKGRPVSPSRLFDDIAGFYRSGDVPIEYRHTKPDGTVEKRSAPADVPFDEASQTAVWRAVATSDVRQAFWRLPTSDEDNPFGNWANGQVVHNGIVVGKPGGFSPDGGYKWRDGTMTDIVERPAVSILDPEHRVPIALDRFDLADGLPFEGDLLESIGLDLVAHALVGQGEHPLLARRRWRAQTTYVRSKEGELPLLQGTLPLLKEQRVCVVWGFDGTHPWASPVGDNPLGDISAELGDAGLGPVPWAHVGLDQLSLDDHVVQDIEAAGYPLEALRYEINAWADRLSAQPVATVVVRGAARPTGGAQDAKIAWYSWEDEFIEADWRSLADAEPDQDDGVFFAGHESPDFQLEGQLRDAAVAIADGGKQMVALTMFGSFGEVSEFQARLAAPWVSLLGRAVPSGSGRTTMRREAQKSEPRLKPLVEYWTAERA